MASAVALTFHDTKLLKQKTASHSHLVGHPVRPDIANHAAAEYHQPIGGGPVRLLITGGSQGATFFSRIMPEVFGQLPDRLRRRLSIVQQCREEDIAAVRDAYTQLGVAAELSTFFENMAELIEASHLVICRSGASSIAEVTTIGRPSIMVPYPHAINDHQRENAAHVRDSGGGWLFEEKDLTPDLLASHIEYLIAEPCALASAAAAAASMGHATAALKLADLVQTLAATSRRAKAQMAQMAETQSEQEQHNEQPKFYQSPESNRLATGVSP
jgi:UDP-N-acetylglucosamine--N-acetylmuramyl-(pentapeptide) pyrophosphoryl-undecaprenol N-acetylglucosamine transferase